VSPLPDVNPHHISEEKQLTYKHLFKGGGQDSSSLKGTRQAFSRDSDVQMSLDYCCVVVWRIDVRAGQVFLILVDFPGFSLDSDCSWIFVPHSAGLVFSRPVGFIPSPKRFSHGSDHCFSSGRMDGFSKDTFSRLSDYVKDMSKFQHTHAYHT